MKNKQKTGWYYKVPRRFNKKDELKQILAIFPQHLMNDLIRNKLKESVSVQDIIKIDKQFCC